MNCRNSWPVMGVVLCVASCSCAPTKENKEGAMAHDATSLSITELEQILSDAASLSAQDYLQMTDDLNTEGVRQSLTALLLMTPMTRDTTGGQFDEEFALIGPDPRGLRKATEYRIADNDASLVERSSRAYSWLHPGLIKRLLCVIRGDAATGEVTFGADGLYHATVQFTCKNKQGSWHVTEFRLPVRGIGTAVGPDGQWKFFGMEPWEERDEAPK